MTKRIRLKKDIIIPAGTIMGTAPVKTVRDSDYHFDCVIGLTDDSHGFFAYCVDDEKLDDWFEDAGCPDDKYKAVKEKFKNGDWVIGTGEYTGCSQVFTGDSGDFQPFSYLNAINPDDFRLATKAEIDNSTSRYLKGDA